MSHALWGRDELAEDAKLELAPVTPGGSFGGLALAYNARDPAAVDAVLAEAEAAGATILKPAGETAWGGYAGYFADPDGHPWEVAHNPFWRSEEHTSELQSLMRISYAVFCLKKKKQQNIT